MRLAVPDLVDAFVDVLVGDLRVLVGDFDALVFAQFDGRHHLERRLELQRLAVMQMDVADIGRPHNLQAFDLELLLQVFGDQSFQYALPDVTGELLTNQRCRRFSGPESRQLGLLYNVGHDLSRFGLYRCGRNGNFESVLAAFY